LVISSVMPALTGMIALTRTMNRKARKADILATPLKSVVGVLLVLNTIWANEHLGVPIGTIVNGYRLNFFGSLEMGDPLAILANSDSEHDYILPNCTSIVKPTRCDLAHTVMAAEEVRPAKAVNEFIAAAMGHSAHL